MKQPKCANQVLILCLGSWSIWIVELLFFLLQLFPIDKRIQYNLICTNHLGPDSVAAVIGDERIGTTSWVVASTTAKLKKP